MKKKYRDIIIDNTRYSWSVASDHDEGIMIKLFKEGKEIGHKYIYGNPEITPSYIKDLIKNQQ
jgi:hypothetical protein